ncbi:hypothetical protein BGZ76_011397 [Entomortierella beljakovae]|nr:hypothetical protein BGZ76_011397 [Entomortierella beljakovae]
MTTDNPVEPGPGAGSEYFSQFQGFSPRKNELPKNALNRLASLRNWSDKRIAKEKRKLDVIIAKEYTEEDTEELGSTFSNLSLNGNNADNENLQDQASGSRPSYFLRFPDFTFKKGEHSRNAFKRLAKLQNWSKNTTAAEKKKFHESVAQELGAKASSLQFLQDLCEALFVLDHAPTSITQCKNLLKTKYVNIWDIYEENYKYFDSYKEFRKYTRNGRVFKKEVAKMLGLNVFLRIV